MTAYVTLSVPEVLVLIDSILQKANVLTEFAATSSDVEAP